MKRKMNKQLTLNKETIANLGARELNGIRGGFETDPLECPTQEPVCTTGCTANPKCWSENPIFCGTESC